MINQRGTQPNNTKTIFANRLPLKLLDTMPDQKTKISVSLHDTELKIRYEYSRDIKKLPTFEINTIPFLLNNNSLKLELPS